MSFAARLILEKHDELENVQQSFSKLRLKHPGVRCSLFVTNRSNHDTLTMHVIVDGNENDVVKEALTIMNHSQVRLSQKGVDLKIRKVQIH